MDSSRRAVESYWRSRMIDGATSDEDKVTPVYKLDEICELLRSSHVTIVKEVSDFILKRLDHRSPVVKQKALRLIKYAVGKSGVEFRREMQRHSAAVRQLFHYKGQMDSLKGDALNKAVRDTAHETISAIFSEENGKPAAPAENLNKRIQGFGNTNFDMPYEDKKSFLTEVVGLGSASIKQGITSLKQSHSSRKNDNGSYKSPNLHRSLTIENDDSDRYQPVQLNNEPQGSFGGFQECGYWTLGPGFEESKTREEKLLETLVTSGGVRLQPTRDAIQAFLVEAAKLDALALSDALESKLQSPVWQVRMKAVCLLESILRRKDDEHFSIVYSYFSENKDSVVRCSESPQNSLREKAIKVLSLLGGEPLGDLGGNSVKAEAAHVQMPDLIDTGDSDDFFGTDDSIKKQSEQLIVNPMTSATPLIDDLFGDNVGTSVSTGEQKNEDPFADVSFHTSEGGEHEDDLFSGMTFDDKPGVSDLMAGMSINENVSKTKLQVASPAVLTESLFSDLTSNPSHQVTNDALNGSLGLSVTGVNVNPLYPSGTVPYNMHPGIMLNSAFQSQPMNYAAMGNFLAQQQFLATMSNIQHLSNLNVQNAGVSHASGTDGGGYSSAHPDIFQSNFPNQVPTSTMNNSKKEDTRAFDFISDHVAAARDPRRVA
ncbi:hypothetical protein OIU85_026780 [Salix viminalis]|uniref:VHS domain-containing protein n=1 Tax=Salix viminalis TaxID=40686 RepID=A0A9Q0TPF4_SALVM|nr:hypothetical protein OIU85_026780 [Salix viminalis]